MFQYNPEASQYGMGSPEAKRRKLMEQKHLGERPEGTGREQTPPFYLTPQQMAMLNFLQQQNPANLSAQHQQQLHQLQQQYQAQQQHQHMMKQQQLHQQQHIMQVRSQPILFSYTHSLISNVEQGIDYHIETWKYLRPPLVVCSKFIYLISVSLSL